MSLIPLGLDIAVADALDLINPVLFRQRNIGGFVADVTIEEVHTDQLQITRSPVEQGAAVTDHAYLLPASVLIKAGWSNSSAGAQGNPEYVNEVYQALLDLQASREPFDIVTGKRSYSNMLIGRIHARTDEASENSLMLEADCREIILVNTQTVSVPSADQASPEATGGTVNRGNVAASNAGEASGGGGAPIRIYIQKSGNGSTS